MAEEEIKKMNEDLETKVLERTNQLELSNKELEAFTYSVSHDLRAPLRAINGFTRILLDDYATHFDEEGKEIAFVIVKNALKMGKLIDDLLAFSKMGKAALQRSNIDMQHLVEAIYDEITSEEERKRINFTIINLPEANGDKNLIGIVWTNLIMNAVKFTAFREKAEIEIYSTSDEKYISYHVKDNGAGFNMKYKDKLFGVFQRLHSEEEFSGTGVGLALVQRIILQHNGHVWAKGEIDKGAEFIFSLPIH